MTRARERAAASRPPPGADSGIIGMILARGGSKGLPGKNLRSLAGRPLLAYTVEVARSSRVFDEVVVSTDDVAIAQAARDLGAAVPFMRPPGLARDDSPSHDALVHAVDFMESNGRSFAALMLLQPTSPLRSVEDIVEVARRVEAGAQAVVAVTEATEHPLWMKRIDPQTGFLRPFAEEPVPHRRQDLPLLYVVNGAIYAARLPYWKEHGGFYGPATEAHVMPRERSVDLDDEFDWAWAEGVLSSGRGA